MKNKILAIISLLLLSALLLCSCSQKKVISPEDTGTSGTANKTNAVTEATVAPVNPTESKPRQTSKAGEVDEDPFGKYMNGGSHTADIDSKLINSDQPIVILKIKDKGYAAITLFPGNAPNTVNNFISRVMNGDYDGISFMNFDSRLGILSSAGEAGYTLEYEKVDSPIIRRSENIVFMNKDAKTGDTSGSNFFICLDETLQKDYTEGLYQEYVAIGELIEGVDIFEKAAVGSGGSSSPLTEVLTVEQAVVDLNGYTVTETAKK